MAGVSSNDQLAAPAEAASLAAQPGDAWRVSGCCLADVENRVERVHNKHDWHASTFRCTGCGKECATYTNPALVALEQQVRELKARLGDD